jgi:small GTP-binding protein
MGNTIRQNADRIMGINRPIEKKAILLGLEEAGKTKLLYRMKLDKVITTIPTIGFNVEHVTTEASGSMLQITCWDIGGQEKIRALWRHYYESTDLLIYVVDASDKDRMQIAKEELFRVLSAEALRETPLVVLANKQDSERALAVFDVIEVMELNTVKDRIWSCLPTSATTGEGLKELKEWLSDYFIHGVLPGPSIAVTLHSEMTDSLKVSCISMAGSEVACFSFTSVELRSVTVRDLKVKLADHLKNIHPRIKLLLPTGEILEDDTYQLLSDALSLPSTLLSRPNFLCSLAKCCTKREVITQGEQ